MKTGMARVRPSLMTAEGLGFGIQGSGFGDHG